MRFFRYLLNKVNWTTKTMLMLLLMLWIIMYLASAIYQAYKPLPQGLNVAMPLRPADQVQFLADYTFINEQGQRVQEPVIFDHALEMITQARRMIVLDMFLFNDYVGKSAVVHRPLTRQLTQALINKHALEPDVQITVITDPVNTVYGGAQASNLLELRRAGIEVVETNLKPLRASNPLWSGLWFICCQGLGNNAAGGWLPNPLGQDKITLRSYLSLFNFKANHRKTLVTDASDGWQALVTSANPHDASSWHDNVAMTFHGQAALDVLETERAVARLSHVDLPFIVTSASPAPSVGQPQLQVLTEGKIQDALLSSLNSAQAGDQIAVSVFYLSERRLITALKAAQQRGVQLKVLLDPNEDAFGRKKNGIPNRQVAWELHQAGIPLRWCKTTGEQCHSKMLLKTSTKSGQGELILGSANFTRRNLNNLNLETNVRFIAGLDNSTVQNAQAHFDRIWFNQKQQHSVGYNQYMDESRLKYWWYRFSEWSGLSTF